MSVKLIPLYVIGAVLLPIVLFAALVSVAVYKIEQAYRAVR
jgi:hypothetical protein